MPTAKEIMTTEPVTVSPGTSVKELAVILEDNNFTGAPVVDEDGKLVGVVTESDLIDQHKNLHLPTVITIFDWVLPIGGGGETEKELKKMAGSTVADIMSEDVVTVDEDASLEDIATIMSEQKVHFVPVMSGEKLVGIVDRSDVVKAIIKGE